VEGEAGFLAADAGFFLAGTGLAAAFLATGFTAFFTTGFFAAFLAVFAMVMPLPALRNKTPGTDYSGEYSERKTETKLLTEKEKSVRKLASGPTRSGGGEFDETIKAQP
jgi:hypothetical protein